MPVVLRLAVALGLKLSYISHIFFNLRIVVLVFLHAALVTTGPSFLNLLVNINTKVLWSTLTPDS